MGICLCNRFSIVFLVEIPSILYLLVVIEYDVTLCVNEQLLDTHQIKIGGCLQYTVHICISQSIGRRG